MFGNSVNIWDFHKNERVKIGIETWRDPTLVPIYGLCKVENCMVVSSETVHEALEEQKLFCLAPTTRYCGSMIRMEVFWPFKDLLLNDELAIMVLDQGYLIMER